MTTDARVTDLAIVCNTWEVKYTFYEGLAFEIYNWIGLKYNI